MARDRPAIWPALPDQDQLRLLRLVLAPGIPEAALAAWASRVDPQKLDEGSARLLPALHRRLTAAGIDHPWLPMMRAAYRRTLYRNRVTIHRGLALADALQDQGMASLLLKGSPLIALYYGDPGLRPMGDVDLLIGESVSRRQVEDFLTGSGRARLRDRNLHADTYVDGDGFEYDVHWHLVPELAVAGSSRELWERAQDVVIEGRRFRTLSAQDHVFHALIHGLRASGVPPLRWIVDTAVIAGKLPSFDWLLLAGQAKRSEMTVPVACGLGFLLDQEFLGDGAKAALAALALAPAKDRRLFVGLMRPPGLAFRCLRPWLLYRRLARLARSGDASRPRLGFARFLADLWNLETRREIPKFLWSSFRARQRGQKPGG
jgi:hypothetical protein